MLTQAIDHSCEPDKQLNCRESIKDAGGYVIMSTSTAIQVKT